MQSLLALSHPHASEQLSVHDLRPHFHLRMGLDRHNHHPGRSGDCHLDQTCDLNLRGAGRSAQPELSPAAEHDADAIYFDGLDLIVCERPAVHEQLTQLLHTAGDAWHMPVGDGIDGSLQETLQRESFSPHHWSGALYLCQHALLI